MEQKQLKFSVGMQKKLVILSLIVLLAFIGLSVRLILINKENGDQYKRQVLSQQEYDSVTLPYRRGDILDAKGTALAISEKVYNVIIDAKILTDKETYLEPTIAALNQCFTFDEAELRKQIRENPKSQYYILLKQQPYELINQFLILQNGKESTADTEEVKGNSDIKGVWFEEEYIRSYPYNNLASDLIGFTSKDNTGMYGLEEYYNDILNGFNGREYGYLSDASMLERTTKPAVDGKTLVTTIDVNIQSIVEKYILQFNQEHKDEARDGEGSYNTGCIIMDVNTGNILAMASYPNFNLNDPKDISAYYSEEELAAMDEATLQEAWNSLWRNFCIFNTYEPGSTYKPFTMAGGLETGKLSGNEHYVCTGSATYSEHLIHCNNRLGHGELDFSGALENSCNVALMEMSMAIGKDMFMKYHRFFNFGLKTNIDLAGETKTDTLQFNADTMVASDLATSSFGQGFNVTMIQMITGFCSLLNGGKYYEPHVVSKILNPDGSVSEEIEPRLLKQTISETTSKKMIELLNAVVSEGTGSSARPAGYMIGGKTGTAETLPRDTGNYVVSFMGYAPADDPQIAIYVVVDRPNVEHQDSAKYATKIVRNILTEVLPYLNIFMTEELTEEEVAELSTMQYYIPEVTTAEETTTEETTTEETTTQETTTEETTTEETTTEETTTQETENP